jgi:hypothetical protein
VDRKVILCIDNSKSISTTYRSTMLRFASSRALSNARSVMIRRAEAVQPAGNTEKLLEMGKGDWHKLSVADKAASMSIFVAEFIEQCSLFMRCLAFFLVT